MRKIIISLMFVILLTLGYNYYRKQQTQECWWSVMYPSLTFVGVEDDYGSRTVGIDLNQSIKREDNPKISFALLKFLTKRILHLADN